LKNANRSCVDQAATLVNNTSTGFSFFFFISMSSISASGARGSVDLDVSFVATAATDRQTDR